MTDPTDPHPTLAHAVTFHLDAFASHRDGTSRGDALAIGVHVQFVAGDMRTGPSGDVVDDIQNWLLNYFDGHDLTDMLEFAPTAQNLAIWTARVCEQFAGPLFAAVTVTVQQRAGAVTEATVRYRP